jgi:hypothetical protein
MGNVAIGTPAAIAWLREMRASSVIAAFLLTTLGLMRSAAAHPPLWAPRVSLSLALDWNKLADEAIHRPKANTPARVRRHTIPKLTVTAAAPPRAAQLDVAAYGRVENAMRDVLIPHYVQPDVEHRQMFRQFYLAPYTPYLGCYGFNLTVETDAVMR